MIGVVGDDIALCAAVEHYLRLDGYHATITTLQDHKKDKCQLLVIDLATTEQPTSSKVQLPLLFVLPTYRSEERSALSSATTDALVRPVDRVELRNLVRTLLDQDHFSKGLQDVLEIGDIVLNLKKREIYLNRERADLSPKDFDLAVLLFRNLGRTISREQLLRDVWGAELNDAPGWSSERTVDTHISRLRRKLGLTPDQGWRLSAIYGRGYRLENLK